MNLLYMTDLCFLASLGDVLAVLNNNVLSVLDVFVLIWLYLVENIALSKFYF